MTKYLVKIISICAFIVLIPVIIAGVALSAIGSTLYNVDVFVAFATSAQGVGTDYKINLYQEGTDAVQQNKATFLNGTDVAVNLDLTGYDFLGWFKGDDKNFSENRLDKENEGTQNTNYTFELSGNTQLTAKLQVKTYTLNFVGIDDEYTITQDNVSKTKDQINGTYYYGQELPVLHTTDERDEFPGWIVYGQETAEPATAAIFDVSAEYTLSPAPWAGRMSVAYYAENERGEWTVFYTANYDAEKYETFAFPTLAGDDEATSALKNAIMPGYKFDNQWSETQNGVNVTAEQLRAKHPFAENATVQVYLKQTPIDYTLKVKKFAESEGQDVKSVTFNAKTTNNLTNKLVERDYYTLTGLKFNGKDYTYDNGEYKNGTETLQSAIYKAESADHTFEVVAIWTCDYPSLSFSYEAHYTDAHKNVYDIFMGEDHVALPTAVNNAGRINLDFTTEENKLEDDVFDKLIKHGQDVKFYYDEQYNGNYVEVELDQIVLRYGSKDIQVSGKTTLQDVSFTYLVYQMLEVGDLKQQQILETNAFVIEFVFKPVV